MAIQWPKELRVLAREGFEADAVIIGFRSTDHAGGSQPVARVIGPDAAERVVSNGLSTTTNDPRGRGDLLRVVVSPSRDLAVVLAEPVPFADAMRQRRESLGSWNPAKLAGGFGSTAVDWGHRVEGTVVALVSEAGGTRTVVHFDGHQELVGPVIAAPDPRRVSDVIDIGLGPDRSVVRPPAGPGAGAAELRAEMAREPGLLRKVWSSSWI